MIDKVLIFGEKAYLSLGTWRNSWLPQRRIGRDIMQRRTYRKMKTAYQDICSLDCELWLTEEPVPFAQRNTGKHQTLRVGETWSHRTFDCAWMHVTGQVPEGIDPADPALCILADVAGEGLIVNAQGQAVQGITSYTSFFDFRQGVAGKAVVLPDGLIDAAGRIDFWIDAAANDLFGSHFGGKLEPTKLRKLHLARCDFEKRALFYDCAVLAGGYDGMKRDKYSKSLYAAVQKALKTGDRSLLKPFLEAKNDDPNVFEYCGQGHSHLDLAWLWPIRETKRKGARTFSSQIVNLTHYPEAKFGASQAQLYQWMKEGYPEIYEKVKVLHKEGRWEIQGATWVEPDSNLMGGESMIRQFFYGKQFFRAEFGDDPQILWLPDSFGYSASFPQVARLAGVPYFLTQKLSWNTVNKFPYHTFHWKALDGSPVLAHMLPEDTYNAAARPDLLYKGEKNYKERKISRRAASLFGIGDGGGGPGFEHYERARRMADLKGLPKFTQDTMRSFFQKLAEEDGGRYATHQGELYLEKHQGTYTTHARNKKYNRKCEFLLRNYEILAAQASSDLPISLSELDEIWKEVLLYQFHDILPGSSINRVYVESVARYELLMARLQEGIEALLAQIYGGGVVNLNSFAYSGLLQDGKAWRKVEIPAFGAINLSEAPEISAFCARAKGNVIENDCARVTFKDGLIVSYIHKKSGKELAQGPLNKFTLYGDVGDCWDIRPAKYYKMPKKHAKCTSFSVGTDGAKAFAKVEFRVGSDVIVQEISLTDGAATLRFSTKIDRKPCKRKMLRVGFALHMPAQASFNVPFGHVERATTEKNSIEAAQYEVSGQKFVDLSGEEFGISLLNDCKYGFRCKNGWLDIDLLRSPRGGPSKGGDFGEHSLEYALYPHEGPLGVDTYREAYFLNNPILQGQGGHADARPPFLASSNERIIIESVKLPEDGNGLLVRVYNCGPTAQSGALRVAGYQAQSVVGVMEEALAPASESLDLQGFELKIIRFVKE